MHKGIVKFFNQKNKFGFIVDEDTKKEYYVQSKNVQGNIEQNDLVSFELKAAKRGDECINVKKIAS